MELIIKFKNSFVSLKKLMNNRSDFTLILDAIRPFIYHGTPFSYNQELASEYFLRLAQSLDSAHILFKAESNVNGKAVEWLANQAWAYAESITDNDLVLITGKARIYADAFQSMIKTHAKGGIIDIESIKEDYDLHPIQLADKYLQNI
jgi:hypothetical protein